MKAPAECFSVLKCASEYLAVCGSVFQNILQYVAGFRVSCTHEDTCGVLQNLD